LKKIDKMKFKKKQKSSGILNVHK